MGYAVVLAPSSFGGVALGLELGDRGLHEADEVVLGEWG